MAGAIVALETTITPAKVSVELGQAAPAPGSVTDVQWAQWITDALMLIQIRADSLGVTAVSQAKLDYVIRQAVADHVKRPDNATQVSIQVDDGSVSKSYRSGAGRVTILDEWWSLLGLNPHGGSAFEVDTMPADAGVVQDPESVWYPVEWTGNSQGWL